MPLGLTHLRLTGPAELWVDGRLRAIERRRARALLIVLGAERGEQTRARLLDLLWPDLDRVRGLRILRSALSELRRVLPSGALHVERDRIALRGLALDLDALDPDRFAHEPSERAAQLTWLRGSLVDGFEVESEPFMAWLTAARARHQGLVLDTFEQACASLERAGAGTLALDVAGRLAALAPYDERSHRLVMGVAGRQGRATVAFEQFERCRQLLGERFGVEPSAETRRLLTAASEAHRSHEPAEPEPSEVVTYERSIPGAFVERAARWAEGAARAEGAVLLVGPLGSGLSAVLEELRARATAPPEGLERPLVVHSPPSGGWSEAALSRIAATARATRAPTLVGSRVSHDVPGLTNRRLLGLDPEDLASAAERWATGRELGELGRAFVRVHVGALRDAPVRAHRLLARLDDEVFGAPLADDAAADRASAASLGAATAGQVAALAVFPGWFSAAAARQVCGVELADLEHLARTQVLARRGPRHRVEPWARTALGPPPGVTRRFVAWVLDDPAARPARDLAAAMRLSDPATLAALLAGLGVRLERPDSELLSALGAPDLDRIAQVVAGGLLDAQTAARWTFFEARARFIRGGASVGEALVRARVQAERASALGCLALGAGLHAQHAANLGCWANAENALAYAEQLASQLAQPDVQAELEVMRFGLGLERDLDLGSTLVAARSRPDERLDGTWPELSLELACACARRGHRASFELLAPTDPDITDSPAVAARLAVARAELAVRARERSVGAARALDLALSANRPDLAAEALALWSCERVATADAAARGELDRALALLRSLGQHRRALELLGLFATSADRADRGDAGALAHRAREELRLLAISTLADRLDGLRDPREIRSLEVPTRAAGALPSGGA